MYIAYSIICSFHWIPCSNLHRDIAGWFQFYLPMIKNAQFYRISDCISVSLNFFPISTLYIHANNSCRDITITCTMYLLFTNSTCVCFKHELLLRISPGYIAILIQLPLINIACLLWFPFPTSRPDYMPPPLPTNPPIPPPYLYPQFTNTTTPRPPFPSPP